MIILWRSCSRHWTRFVADCVILLSLTDGQKRRRLNARWSIASPARALSKGSLDAWRLARIKATSSVYWSVFEWPNVSVYVWSRAGFVGQWWGRRGLRETHVLWHSLLLQQRILPEQKKGIKGRARENTEEASTAASTTEAVTAPARTDRCSHH